MLLSEYIADLQQLLTVCGDLEVVQTTRDGSRLIRAWKAGGVTAIANYHPNLKPGHSWREPINWRECSEEPRVRLIKIS